MKSLVVIVIAFTLLAAIQGLNYSNTTLTPSTSESEHWLETCSLIFYKASDFVMASFLQICLFVKYLCTNYRLIVIPLKYFLLKAAVMLGLPLFVGVGVWLFSWNIVYYNSHIPGVSPPTPLSPRKFRERSGHSFHLNYVMTFVMGVTAFVTTLWSQLNEH